MVRIFLIAIPFFACNSAVKEDNKKSEVVQTESIVSDTVKASKVDNTISDVNCCIDSILSQYDKSNLIFTQDVNCKIENNQIKIDGKNKQLISKKYVKDWINGIIPDSLKSYSINTGMNEYYFFSSQIKDATGFAVNFTSWFIFDRKNNETFTINSLSSNSKALFFDKSSNDMIFITFNFSEKFIHDKDFDNILYLSNIYKFNLKGERTKSDYQSNCKCK